VRPNPVKKALADGETVFGTMMFEFLSPGLPQILQNAGAQYVFYDMEHSGFGMHELKNQLALCRGANVVPLVRPPATSYQHSARLLDLGAMGLLFQMCESAEEAEQMVRWTRYPPGGVRGAMFGGAHDDYGSDPMGETMAAADDRTLVCVLLETAKGLANAEEIMSVPGVDVAHLGHADLSMSLGVPGELEHPKMQAGIDTILGACEQHGKSAACLVGSVEQGHDWMARGFRMVSYLYDIGLMTQALGDGIAGLRAT